MNWLWPFAKLRAQPVVRRQTVACSSACARIHAQAFPRGWSATEIDGLVSDPSVVGHVALDPANRGVWGFSLCRRAGQEAEILTIVVDPGRQHRGIGRALMAAQISELRQMEVEELFLEVDAGNAPAVALYRSFGFRQVGERKAYYARPGEQAASALILRCDLSEGL